MRCSLMVVSLVRNAYVTLLMYNEYFKYNASV